MNVEIAVRPQIHTGGPLMVARNYSPSAVRIAVKGDESKLLSLLMLNDEEAICPVSEERLMQAIRRGIDREGSIIGVQHLDGEIIASIGLVADLPWYSRSRFWHQRYCFVHPDHRPDHRVDHRKGGSHILKNLVQFAKWAADYTGMPVIMTTGSGPEMAGKHRLYDRLLQRVGAVYLYRGGFGSKILSKPPEVSLLLAGEEDEMLAFLKGFAAHGAIDVDLTAAMDSIRKATDRKMSSIGVVRRHGEIIGAIGIDIAEPWNSKAWICYERWCFVKPKTSGVFASLAQFAKWYSDQMGRPLVLGVLQKEKTEAKVRLFRKIAPQIETIFLHEPMG